MTARRGDNCWPKFSASQLGGALVLLVSLEAGEASAYQSSLKVCNKIRFEVYAATLIDRKNPLFGDTMYASGWQTVAAGDCRQVFFSTDYEQAVNLAIRIRVPSGATVVLPGDVGEDEGARSSFCVADPMFGGFFLENSAALEPCVAPSYAVRTASHFWLKGNVNAVFEVELSTTDQDTLETLANKLAAAEKAISVAPETPPVETTPIAQSVPPPVAAAQAVAPSPPTGAFVQRPLPENYYLRYAPSQLMSGMSSWDPAMQANMGIWHRFGVLVFEAKSLPTLGGQWSPHVPTVGSAQDLLKTGLLISGVAGNAPLKVAGLQEGDCLHAISQYAVRRGADIELALNLAKVARSSNVLIWEVVRPATRSGSCPSEGQRLSLSVPMYEFQAVVPGGF